MSGQPSVACCELLVERCAQPRCRRWVWHRHDPAGHCRLTYCPKHRLGRSHMQRRPAPVRRRRAICPICQREVALRTDGTFSLHHRDKPASKSTHTVICLGSAR